MNKNNLHFQFVNNFKYNKDENNNFMMFVHINKNEELLFTNNKYHHNEGHFIFYRIVFCVQGKNNVNSIQCKMDNGDEKIINKKTMI